MKDVKRFVVKKDAKTDVISYVEYDKLKGYTLKPKETKEIDELINVNKIVIINPSLIEKLINKKCRRTLEKIIKMISFLDEESSDDSNAGLIIDMIDHFRALIIEKYQEYMDPKEVKILLKKLDILMSEVKLRLYTIEMEYENSSKKSR